MKTKKGKETERELKQKKKKGGNQEKKSETRKPAKGKLCLLSQLT